MNSNLDPPLTPRSGHTLQVLLIARISTVHQDVRSLADQLALCERFVRDRYNGSCLFANIQGQGSGETLDRKDLADAEAAVESRRYDLVVVEDLGRICRRNRAIDFCEMCEDADTRLLAINDSIDTARDDWRLNAFFASFKHESGNKDTSRRICRSLRNRFEQGGVVQTFQYGYIKPIGATSDSEVFKDPGAEPVYEGWLTRLENGASYSEVADWLNAQRISTGVWSRSKKWTGAIVARLTRNPILKGYRRRNVRMSRRVNRTGRRHSVLAPSEEHMYRIVPHLAFIEPARYDRLITKLDARLAGCGGRRKLVAEDTGKGVLKKRTVWPGQHVVCGICGRQFYWGGHGQAAHMMCAGARDYTCWNAATFDGVMGGSRFAQAVLSVAEGLPDFDESFRARVEAAARSRISTREGELRQLTRDAESARNEVANLVDAIARSSYSPALGDRLAEVETRKARLESLIAGLLEEPDDIPRLPPLPELKRLAYESVSRLAFDDPEFGRLMHRVVPRIEVFPYILIDGGSVVLRARIEVDLAPIIGPAGKVLRGIVTQNAMVDLFDPPQRAVYREQIVALREGKISEREVARRLGLTVTAAQRGMALQRKMETIHASDPYRPVTSPQEWEGRLRRHKHPRYHFRPLERYPAW